jgi:dUTP pyrophosphatase
MSNVVKIKYHAQISDLENIEGAKSDWIDLRTADNYYLHKGDFVLINLGVSMELPEGYEAHIVPRSSTFKEYGVIMTNSVGIIDNAYNGDDDIWRFPVYATRDVTIPFNKRICQFRLFKNQEPIEFVKVKTLDNENRGGIGSTGTE